MNNPPAFPHTVELRGVDQRGIIPHGGMTLRDYFAAKAMPVFYMNLTGEESLHPDAVAFWCYSMADAMLKARKQ